MPLVSRTNRPFIQSLNTRAALQYEKLGHRAIVAASSNLTGVQSHSLSSRSIRTLSFLRLRAYQHTGFFERQICEMTSGPDPLDLKYAPGAEQARQDVMVGVSTVMTFMGGQLPHTF